MPPHQGTKWQVPGEYDDIALLRELAAAGKSRFEIATEMTRRTGRERRPDGVRQKAKREKIRITPAIYGEGTGTAQAPPETPPESLESEGDPDNQYLRSNSSRIRTVEQLLAKAEIDTDVWEVYFQKVKQYEGYVKNEHERPEVVPMFAVEVKLRRNQQVQSIVKVASEAIARMESHAPQYASRIYAGLPKASLLAEFNVTDMHVGKAPINPHDVASEDVFRPALEYMIGKATRESVARNLMPFGSDFAHIDNLARSTTKGTPQDVSADWEDLFVLMYELMVWGIDRLLEVAPVDLVVYRGNHGRQTEFSLAHAIQAHYRNCKHVTVDNDKSWRKYYRYHRNLIGFTHGDQEKHTDLPMLMAQECPQDWAETEFREVHIGHRHTKKEIKWMDVDEQTGVVLRQLQSLSPLDSWHRQKGFLAFRSANCFVWHPEHGMVDNIPVPLRALLPAPDRAA